MAAPHGPLRRRLLAVTIFVAAMLVPGAGAVSADTGSGAVATFRSGTIDLSKGWGDATACVAFAPADVRCYATRAEADAASAAERGPAAGASDDVGLLALDDHCPDNWLCIFEHNNFQGRRLQFRDGYWQDLGPYGFSEQASSWVNNQDCNLLNSKTDDGGLNGYPFGFAITLSACALSSALGDYDNWARGVRG